LIIGVGKVTELVLRYLKNEEAKVIFVSNRTFEKAKKLADKIDARAVRFDDLKSFLNKADIVITATASPHFIIKKRDLVQRAGQKKKLLLMDLALPRDVDPLAGEMKNIDLFFLDDLKIIIKKNIKKKIQELKKIKKIRDKEAAFIWQRLIKLELEPVLWP